jgi:hypothetical protein
MRSRTSTCARAAVVSRTVYCPACHKKLRVGDSQRAAAGRCPACGEKFRLPEVPPEYPVAKPVAPPPPPRVVQPVADEEPVVPSTVWRQGEEVPSYSLRADRHQPPEAVPLAEEYAPDEPDDDVEDEPRPRKKRKKKRRKSSPGMSLEMSNFLITLGVLGVVWLGLAILVLVQPGAFLLALILGFLIASIGQSWFMRMAFEDGVGVGLSCMFIPFYTWFYLFNNFARAGRPFAVRLIGIFIIITGFVAYGIRYGLDAFQDEGDFDEPEMHEPFDGRPNPWDNDWEDED